jgi:acetyl esterase/lipase
VAKQLLFRKGELAVKIAKKSYITAVCAVIAAGLIPAAMTQPISSNTLLDVPYGPAVQQRLDVYKPSGTSGLRPSVILIHGGGWAGGDKRDYASIGHLAMARGLVAVAINYRLADGSPQGIWPAQLDDAEAAVRWVRGHAVELGVDPSQVCVLGSSAGGHLAVFLAVLRHSDSAWIACAVDEFGPVDLLDFFHGEGAANMFGKADPAALRQTMQRASPVNLVSKDTAPTLIIQGTADTMVKPEQSETLHAALQRAGVPTKYITYMGGHGFSGLTGSQYMALQTMELDFIASKRFP